MKSVLRRVVSFSTGALAALVCSPAGAQQQGFPAYWINMPGAQSYIEGGRFYERGEYRTAYAQFHHAAFWADKRAQFNLGLMNAQGQVRDMPAHRELPCVGTGRPMACGWAWLELSAEREYPQFRRTADLLWAKLDDHQRREGRRIFEQKLLPRYGDEARLEWTATRMTTMRMRNGVSRSGFSYFTGSAGSPIWDLEKIIAYENRLYRAMHHGRVELGEFRLIDDEDDNEDDNEDDTTGQQ